MNYVADLLRTIEDWNVLRDILAKQNPSSNAFFNDPISKKWKGAYPSEFYGQLQPIFKLRQPAKPTSLVRQVKRLWQQVSDIQQTEEFPDIITVAKETEFHIHGLPVQGVKLSESYVELITKALNGKQVVCSDEHMQKLNLSEVTKLSEMYGNLASDYLPNHRQGRHAINSLGELASERFKRLKAKLPEPLGINAPIFVYYHGSVLKAILTYTSGWCPESAQAAFLAMGAMKYGIGKTEVHLVVEPEQEQAISHLINKPEQLEPHLRLNPKFDGLKPALQEVLEHYSDSS